MSKSTQFKKGNKAAADRVKFRRPRSRIRQTLTSLQEMEETAIKTIKDSLEGKNKDKEAVATAKWLINAIVTVNRAAIADEQFTFSVRTYRDDLKREQEEREAAEQSNGTDGKVIRFSTKLREFATDDDEEDE